jgi:glycerol dehydrogenase
VGIHPKQVLEVNGKYIIYQSVPKFVQGPGVLDSLGAHVRAFADKSRACVLLDRGVRSLRERIASSLASNQIPHVVQEFDGNLSLKHIDRLAAEINSREQPSVFIGVGSGRTIDLSKMLAHRVGARNIVVATSSATDAAPSHAAVGVDEQGHIQAESYDLSPDLVLVDSEVIAKAPVRLFVAGIGDAISKKYELETAVALGESNCFGGQRPYFIDSMAAALHETLLQKGRQAKESVAQGRLCDEVEEVITACVLLSTLVWENGGLAGAHSIANVLFNSGYCREALHGEHVAVGLLLHLALQGKEADLTAIRSFYEEVDLPRRLSGLGSALAKRSQAREIAEGIHQRWAKHHIVFSVDQISAAIEELEKR